MSTHEFMHVDLMHVDLMHVDLMDYGDSVRLHQLPHEHRGDDVEKDRRRHRHEQGEVDLVCGWADMCVLVCVYI